jgi:hypothetical protein
MVRPLSFSLRTADSRLASANFGGHRLKFGDERGFWFCALSAGITLTGSKCPLISLDKFLYTVDVVLVNCPMLARPSHPSPFLPITSLQAQHYHGITHSFAQRQPSIPSIFNSFRTLSIATGWYPRLPSKNPSVSSLWSLRSDLSALCVALFPSLFSCIYKSIGGQLLCFHIHTKPGGVPQPSHFLHAPAFGYNPLALPPSPAGDGATRPPSGFPE